MATGDGDDYTEADEGDLADAIYTAATRRPAAAPGPGAEPGEEPEEEPAGEPEPGEEPEGEAEPGEGEEVTGRVTIRAQVEWSGDVMRANDGVRTVRFSGVRLTEVRQAVANVEAARQAGPEGGYRSYRAKGWRAQLRQTLATKRGREAAERAGFNPDTIRRWRKGTQAPSAASREKIASVWGEVRDPRTQAVRQANHEVTEALTEALREQHGVTVRFRRIESLEINED